mgnify:FL=1
MSFWHWPDRVIGKRESRQLRDEHNATENLLHDAIDLLDAAAARVELEHSEGEAILGAWLPDARALIKKARGT